MTHIDGYTVFHSMRDNDRRGGGVAVYVRSCFKSFKIIAASLILPHFESLLVSFSNGGKTLKVLTIYRPPDSNYSDFIDIFNSTVSNFKPDYICGDFNLDLLRLDDARESCNFLDTIRSYSFLPVINKPTRISNNSATLIDNIFVGSPGVYVSGIITYDLSDHLPIFIIARNSFSAPALTNHVIKFRDTSEVNLSKFCDALQCLDFSSVTDENDLNIACLLYTSPSPRDKRQSRMPSSA